MPIISLMEYDIIIQPKSWSLSQSRFLEFCDALSRNGSHHAVVSPAALAMSMILTTTRLEVPYEGLTIPDMPYCPSALLPPIPGPSSLS